MVVTVPVSLLLLLIAASSSRDVPVSGSLPTSQSEFSRIGQFGPANIGQGHINRKVRQPTYRTDLAQTDHSFGKPLGINAASAPQPSPEAARWQLHHQPPAAWRLVPSEQSSPRRLPAAAAATGRDARPQEVGGGRPHEARELPTFEASPRLQPPGGRRTPEDREAVAALHQLKHLRPREEAAANSILLTVRPASARVPTESLERSPTDFSPNGGNLKESSPPEVDSSPAEEGGSPSSEKATTPPVPQEPETTTVQQQLNLAEAAASPVPEEEPRLLPVIADKRAGLGAGVIHDQPQGDGLFLMMVMGVTLACVGAVLGVGYCVHSPHCPPAPRSGDSSPTFQSTKLAFRSPTDEPVGQPLDNARGQVGGGGGVAPVLSCPRPCGTLQRPTELDTKNKRMGRMESLIDIGNDEDDDGEEEEEDDDTIYECPGLAPPGEMVVSNPFFLSRDLEQLANRSPPHLLPCPVNNNYNMKHGNINVNTNTTAANNNN